MPTQAQSRMQVVRKEEKESKLRQFLQASLETLAAGDIGASREVLLVVRSLESPALRAVAGLSAEIAATGRSLRTLVVLPDVASETAAALPLDLGSLDANFRQARNPRLIDAHEQLVLAPAAIWIGDCMRRDPQKRDAFELFDPTGATALWAARCFDRLWERGEPLDVVRPLDAPSIDSISQAAATAAAEAGSTSVLTRH